MPGESQETPRTGVPDPSVLTTEQMLLAIANLEKLVGAWRDADSAKCVERFGSIATQLTLIETQRVEQKQDTKAAVDAALAAAKEAVKEQTIASQLATGKTETQFADAQKQQGTQHTTEMAAVSTSVSDLKERVAEMQTARRTASAIATGAIGFLTLVIAALAFALSR
jgi:tetrahydromethanopterin S-methyltransferase subunit A